MRKLYILCHPREKKTESGNVIKGYLKKIFKKDLVTSVIVKVYLKQNFDFFGKNHLRESDFVIFI